MISLIIPTYNPGYYIFECLDSIINQDLLKSEFEVLIVLNGSSEQSRFNLEQYIEKLKEYCINLIVICERGVSLARNVGIDNAKGEIIAFVDDDDILSKSYLSNMLKCMKEKSIVVSNVYSFTNNIKFCYEDYISFAFKKFDDKSGGLFRMRSFLSSSCCKLIPRDMIGNKRFIEKFKVGEDGLFMASISNKIENIILADHAIYYRRIRQNSASRKKEKIWNVFLNSICLSYNYFLIYISKPYSYNFLFFLTRYIAPFKRLFF